MLRYRDIEVNTKKLKESLSAVCPLLGVHDVARVRQGGLFLVEVDFTDENRFQNFCKSLSSGMFFSLYSVQENFHVYVQVEYMRGFKGYCNKVSIVPNRSLK